MKRLYNYINKINNLSEAKHIGRQAFLLYITLPLVMCITLMFIIINTHAKLSHMALANLLVLIGSFSLLFYLRKTERYEVVSYMTISLIMMLLLALYFIIGFEYYSLIWSSLFIILSFAILGRRKGLIFAIIFSIFSLTLGVFKYYQLDYNPFNAGTILNITFANFSILLICYYYEYSIEMIQNKIRRNSEKFQTLAITDKLTGLFNRSEIDRRISSEILKASSSDYTFSLLIADLDNFKAVNDKKGHIIGDKVMKQVAGIFKRICSKEYFAGRWGGDEFLVIIPNENRKRACMIGELLRNEIDSALFSKDQ